MKITNENIDEVLFEYFEGNLSEPDKKSVKEFIDNNPEYLEDFRMWEVSNAKLYASESFAIDKELLQTGPMSLQKKLLFSGMGICVVIGAWVFFQFNAKEQSDNRTTPPESVGMETPVVFRNEKEQTNTERRSCM